MAQTTPVSQFTCDNQTLCGTPQTGLLSAPPAGWKPVVDVNGNLKLICATCVAAMTGAVPALGSGA